MLNDNFISVGIIACPIHIENRYYPSRLHSCLNEYLVEMDHQVHFLLLLCFLHRHPHHHSSC